MLRVKNEARWIDEVIESILPLCPRVFVMDDHSTDDTAAICSSYAAVSVLPSPFEGLDEARDKNWLLDRVIESVRPEWVLCIDGDEVLEPNGPDIIRRTIRDAGEVAAFSLKIDFLWNSPNLVRTDRVYGEFWRPSLFRPHYSDDPAIVEELRFKVTPFGRVVAGNRPNLHCSSVPQRYLHGHQRCPARLKHYGYMERERRVQKLDWYTSIDWKNDAEDWYRHMTQGDNVRLDELPLTAALVSRGLLSPADVNRLTNTPANAALVHAGPMRIEPYVI